MGTKTSYKYVKYVRESFFQHRSLKHLPKVDGTKCETSVLRVKTDTVLRLPSFAVVKRGCAKKDVRYNKTGCEEQITGSGNFRLVLCLCNENLCNGKTFHRSAAVVTVRGRSTAHVAIMLSLLSSL